MKNNLFKYLIIAASLFILASIVGAILNSNLSCLFLGIGIIITGIAILHKINH